ncbi:MAG: cobalamin biosynthesis protein CobW [Crocinitomicaceae bacterium]|nr:cobalamin biosynthesis protein CobW [Crocinitomicaceae bacterium]|tara:strand:+ start:34565 stop:35770 length:1206 start_codon:yes stop_codon:yes gene_type:complete
MNEIKKIPVVILNGFLGSGKTTLFRNLLSQSKKKNISLSAIVNDMSELDVDGELLGDTSAVEEDFSILESISSCVLSSKQGIEKLDLAINRLISNKDLEIIIIETSGSCHPMPLVQYFKDQTKLKLLGVFVLIDSLMMAHDFEYGKKLIPMMQQNMVQGKRDTINLLVEQILFCSHLILTKSDRIEEDKLQDISTYVQQINPTASTHSVIFGRLTIESLFELEGYNYSNVASLINELRPVLDSEENSDRPYDIATRVIRDDRPFHPERLWNVCHQYLDKRIYRSKGFFWLPSRDKQSLLWNQAAGGINLELIGTWRSAILEDENNGLLEIEIEFLKEKLAKKSGRFGDRHCDLTVIGDKEHVDVFTEKLKSCFLTEQEIDLWENSHKFKDPWPKNILEIND